MFKLSLKQGIPRRVQRAAANTPEPCSLKQLPVSSDKRQKACWGAHGKRARTGPPKLRCAHIWETGPRSQAPLRMVDPTLVGVLFFSGESPRVWHCLLQTDARRWDPLAVCRTTLKTLLQAHVLQPATATGRGFGKQNPPHATVKLRPGRP